MSLEIRRLADRAVDNIELVSQVRWKSSTHREAAFACTEKALKDLQESMSLRNLDKSDYEGLETAFRKIVEELPLSWVPALFHAMVKETKKRKAFTPTGMSMVVRRIEKEAEVE